MDRDDFLQWVEGELGSRGYGPAKVYSGAPARVRTVVVAMNDLGKLQLMVDVMRRPAGEVRCWLEVDEEPLQEVVERHGLWSHLELMWQQSPPRNSATLMFEARTPINKIRGVKLFWRADPSNYSPAKSVTVSGLDWLVLQATAWAQANPSAGLVL
ncbi:MAG: hypothetical protein H6716_25100 [Polyangiaceae bacterium]|nr:hypothetical protein [Polyangiaceae bacterium]